MDRMTKKELAVGMFEKGLRVEAIAELLQTDPSYVANTLIDRGKNLANLSVLADKPATTQAITTCNACGQETPDPRGEELLRQKMEEAEEAFIEEKKRNLGGELSLTTELALRIGFSRGYTEGYAEGEERADRARCLAMEAEGFAFAAAEDLGASPGCFIFHWP